VEAVQVIISLPLSKMPITYEDRLDAGHHLFRCCLQKCPVIMGDSLEFRGARSKALWRRWKKESEMMCHYEEKHMEPHLAKSKQYKLFALLVLNC
jgi:hypothetical protein